MLDTNMKYVQLLALTLSLLLVGCGGGESSDSADDAGDAAAAEDSGSDVPEMGQAGATSPMAEGGGMDMAAMNNPGGESYGGDDGGYGDYPGGENGYPGGDNGYPGGEEGYPGGYDPEMMAGGGRPQKPARPDNVADWTPEQVSEAIMEGDAKATEAITAFAAQSSGRATGVPQLKTWVDALTKKPEVAAADGGGYPGGGYPGGDPGGNPGGDYIGAGYPGRGYPGAEMNDGNYGGDGDEYGMMGGGYGGGQPSGKEKIAKSLLDGLATNGTGDAFRLVVDVLKGQVDMGIPKPKSMEMAMTTLIKNVANPNNPGRHILQTALTSAPALGATPVAAPAQPGGNGLGQPKPPAPTLQERAKELHLAFAIATMNGLLGADAPPAPPGGQSGGYGGYEDYGAMQGDGGYPGGYAGGDGAFPGAPGMGQQPPAKQLPPVKIQPVALSRDEAASARSYFWSSEMIDYAVQQIETSPESPDAVVFAGAIPAAATRQRLLAAIEQRQNDSPRNWLPENVFTEHLADPAVHVFVKSIPREQPPQANNDGGGPDGYPGERPNARRRPSEPDDPDKLAREAAKHDWFATSEKTMLSLMDRMYAGSLGSGATPYQASDLAIDLHPNAEVTVSQRFSLPLAEGDDSAAQQTVVNYIRIESPQLTQRTVKHYQTETRGAERRTILGGNGMWLDAALRPDRKDGTIRSIDVLLSKNNARPSRKAGRPNQPNMAAGGYPGGEYPGGGGGYSGAPGGGGGMFVVEVLVVEIPDFTNDAQPKSVSSLAR